MKALLTTLFLALLLITGLSVAQHLHAQAAGRISYEGSRRVDPSQMRIVINGQQVRPGSPEWPTDIPDVRTFGQTLTFAGDYGKEAQESNSGAMMRVSVGGGGEGGGASMRAPQMTNLGRPFEEAVYINQKDRTYATVVALKKDDQTTEYRSDVPFAKAEGWQWTDQIKKIAGYSCRKATVPYRKETYTVWVSTELPFTYSPIKELTPDKGVVLAVEGSQEQFRAAKVDLKAPVKEADVRPGAQAQVVTAAQLQDLREKARADFRQRMMENFEGRGANN